MAKLVLVPRKRGPDGKYLPEFERVQNRNTTTAAKIRKNRWLAKQGPQYSSFKHRLKRYDITPEQFYTLLDRQSNSCRICLIKFSEKDLPCVDHDHKTNKVRGLLCRKCNLALGAFKDNDFLLTRTIAYLKHYGTIPKNSDWLYTKFGDFNGQ